MAVIEKRTAKDGKVTYRVKVRLKGYPPQTSTHDRITDAKRWAQSTEAAIKEGRHFKTAQAKKHTVGDLIDRYIRDVLPRKPKSQIKQAAQLLWWKEQIGNYLLSDAEAPLIVEKRDELARGMTPKGTQRSPATVVRYLAVLRHAYSVAVKEWGWLEDSPMRKVSNLKESRGRVRFLDLIERERLFQVCKESSNPYLYPVVLTAISTGMRLGEIMGLTWADIDFQRQRIVIQDSKNGERRSVPLVGTAQTVLFELGRERLMDSSLVFPKGFQKKGAERLRSLSFVTIPYPLSKLQKPVYIRFAWETALKKSKITDFRFHDLRRCAASYLAMSGASLNEIAEILGHKTLAMVKRYAHLSDSHTQSVLERMNEKFVG